MKHTLFFFPVLLLLAFLLSFPSLSLSYAKTGLMLWFYTLLPSLLPFIILSNVLIRTNLLDSLFEKQEKFWHKVFCLSPSGAYALFTGIFCGYPMGAKTTADLYREGRISREEACYLLTFVNHPGPSFLSAYLCTGLFHRADLILPAYIIIYASSFLCSLFFRFRYPPCSRISGDMQKETFGRPQKEIPVSPSLGEILDISIMNGFASITKLGGYIILFAIMQGMLRQMLRRLPDVQYLILGLTEVTTGISAIAQNSWPFTAAFPLALAFTSFGGFCVAAQTKSMLRDTDLPLKPYLKGKLFCSVCTLILAYFLVKIIKVIV